MGEFLQNKIIINTKILKKEVIYKEEINPIKRFILTEKYIEYVEKVIYEHN
jgi:hypothetical protein